MKKKFTILIIAIAFLAGGWQLFAKGPPASPPATYTISQAVAAFISTVNANVQDALDGKAATTVVTDTLGAAYDTNAELKLLLPITQTITIGSEAWTPTAGYRRVDTRATCSGTPSVITVGETGAITDAEVKFLNVGSNDCSIAYATNNFEHNGGTGNSIVVKAGESFEMKFESTAPKWVVTNNNTSTQWISGIATKTPVLGDPDTFDDAGIFGLTNHMYGGTFRSNAAGTALLPPVGVGMNFTYVLESADANIIDPDGTGTADTIIMNGLAAAADENITSSTIGAICYFEYAEADKWMATCFTFAEATP